MTKTLLLASLLASGLATTAQARSLLDGEYRIDRIVTEGRVIRPADERISLAIQGDRVSGFSGCNRFMGQLGYGDGTIRIGPLASTRMACLDEDRAQQEVAILAALQAAQRFALDARQHAVVLRGAQGELVSLRSSPAVREKVLHVAPRRKECAGVGQMSCLEVREAEDQPWLLLYQGIEGFEHENGVTYVLKVREEKVDNPPADASDRRLLLIEVLERKP